MLASKFPFALFTSRLPNIRTLAYTPRLREKISLNPEETIFAKKSRCLVNKQALEKCPKPKFNERCRIRSNIPDNTPHSKCCWSSGDDYRRAHRAIKKRSENLTKLVENATQKILQDVKRGIAEMNENEEALTRRILKSVESRVLELSSLDPVCGMRKKLDVLMLNDRAHQELSYLRYARDLEIESIECELERLNCELKSRANCALDLVYSCRKSESPQDLMRCVEDASREASKILDEARDDFESRMKYNKFSRETIVEEKKRIEEVMKIYEQNMSKLIAGVDNCLRIRKSDF